MVTLLRPPPGAAAAPTSVTSRPFWDGCLQGELLFQRCGDCGAPTHTPSLVCQACASSRLTWERSEGRGEVYSWTVVWRSPTPTFEVPYAPAIIELVEGWHIVSNVIDCEPGALRVGMPVQVVFHPFAPRVVLPYFQPYDPNPGPD